MINGCIAFQASSFSLVRKKSRETWKTYFEEGIDEAN
jgi:hypothetical protein